MSPGGAISLAIGCLAALGVVLAVIYNRLVTLRNRYLNALSQVDVQLKRRGDLVPNLVESVRAYLVHEKSAIEEVVRLRSESAGLPTRSPGRKSGLSAAAVENDLALSRAMARLTAIIESYPELKADRPVADLMEDLASAENRVSYARQAYNDAVMEYNQARETFPALMFASMLGFSQAWLWWSDPAGRTRPSVDALPGPSA